MVIKLAISGLLRVLAIVGLPDSIIRLDPRILLLLSTPLVKTWALPYRCAGAFFLSCLFTSHEVAFLLFFAQGRSATYAGTAGGRLDTPTALRPTYVSTAYSVAARAAPTCTMSTGLVKALSPPRMAFASLRNPRCPTSPRPPGWALYGPTRSPRLLSRPAERGRASSGRPLRHGPPRRPQPSGGPPKRARSNRTEPWT